MLLKLNRSNAREFQAFETELLQLPYVKSISTSSSVPGHRIMIEGAQEIGKPNEFTTRLLFADETFLETYNIELIRGKQFNGNLQREDQEEFMLNEKAAEMLFGDLDPLNRRVVVSGDTGIVIGLVRDFNFQSLHNQVEPLTIQNLPIALFGYGSLKFEAQATADVLRAIEMASQKIYPDLPIIETEFLDDRFEMLYLTEIKLQHIAWVFCLISILLTISGIFGVASYNAQKRAKEIAIRKVLGSNLPGLLKELSKGFIYLLFFGLIIGLPGSYFLADWWLQDFAYRTTIYPGVFVLTAGVMILIVAVSSGFVTIRTARSNPADVLKNE